MRTRTNTQTRRVAALLALGLTLAAGCQAKADEPLPPAAQVQTPTPSPTPTEPASPSPSPTPETYEIPEVMDEVYVERVLNALYRVEGDALRLMIQAGTVTPEAEGMVRALYAEEYAGPLLEAYRADADEGFPGLPSPVGDPTFDVNQVIAASPSCILASGLPDLSGVTTAVEADDREEFLWLTPLQGQEQANPTPWEIRLSIFESEGLPEASQCAG